MAQIGFFLGEGNNRIRVYKVQSQDPIHIIALFRPGTLFEESKAFRAALVETATGIKRVNSQDYLVEDAYGRFVVLKPYEFTKEYGHLLEGEK